MKIAAVVWKDKSLDDYILQVDKTKLKNQLSKFDIPYNNGPRDMFFPMMEKMAQISDSDRAGGGIARSVNPAYVGGEYTESGLNKLNKVLKILGIEIAVSLDDPWMN